MTKMLDCKYRYGFTGTLDGTQTHKWVLEGLFGPTYKIIRTDELMKKGYLSKLNIAAAASSICCIIVDRCMSLDHREYLECWFGP